MNINKMDLITKCLIILQTSSTILETSANRFSTLRKSSTGASSCWCPSSSATSSSQSSSCGWSSQVAAAESGIRSWSESSGTNEQTSTALPACPKSDKHRSDVVHSRVNCCCESYLFSSFSSVPLWNLVRVWMRFVKYLLSESFALFLVVSISVDVLNKIVGNQKSSGCLVAAVGDAFVTSSFRIMLMLEYSRYSFLWRIEIKWR